MSPNLYDRTNRLKDDIIRLKNAVCAYEMTDAAKYPENFEDLGMDIAMRAEAIACTARNLVGSYPVSSRKRMLHTVTDAQGIEVMETEMGYESSSHSFYRNAKEGRTWCSCWNPCHLLWSAFVERRKSVVWNKHLSVIPMSMPKVSR